MTQPSFKKWLESLNVDENITHEYELTVECLKQIAADLEERLNSGFSEKRIVIEILPGLTANIGQQFKIQLVVPGKRFRDGLFRAYIPLDGLPVRLDLYGEELELCPTREDMQKRIFEFLQEIQSRLAQYRLFARE